MSEDPEESEEEEEESPGKKKKVEEDRPKLTEEEAQEYQATFERITSYWDTNRRRTVDTCSRTSSRRTSRRSIPSTS